MSATDRDLPQNPLDASRSGDAPVRTPVAFRIYHTLSIEDEQAAIWRVCYQDMETYATGAWRVHLDDPMLADVLRMCTETYISCEPRRLKVDLTKVFRRMGGELEPPPTLTTQELAAATATHISNVQRLDLDLREAHRAKHGRRPTWQPLFYPHVDPGEGWLGPLSDVASTAMAPTPADVDPPVSDALLSARIIVRLLGHWATIEDQRKNRKHLRGGDPFHPILPPR